MTYFLSYLHYAGVLADNPFTPSPEAQFYPYNFGFDIEFPVLI